MSDVQERVQRLIDDLTERNAEGWLQVAVYHDGELVVDAWSGKPDPMTGHSVSGDTLFTAFSNSKGITFTAIHILAERGLLDYDTPIATYWPEFATNGKGDITLRHVLTHTAGLSGMPKGVTPDEICDWDFMCSAIASLRPCCEPGAQCAYQVLTQGWILGKVAEMADGRRFPTIVQEEIIRPLGLEGGLYFGIPDEAEPRVARLENGPDPEVDPEPGSLLDLATPASLRPTPDFYNRSDVRRAVIPSAGAIMNARSLARHYAAVAGLLPTCGLLSPQCLARVTALQTAAQDGILQQPVRRGLGYFLGAPFYPMGNRPTAFGHPGAGGAWGFADPEYRLAFALLKSRLMWKDPPGQSTGWKAAREVRAALNIPE